MFYFYGSKQRLSKYYPPPKHDLLIEPFAGSAKYSLKYWDRDVVLYDIDKTICDIWDFLINCSPLDIISLPDVNDGCTIPDCVPYPQNALIGFCINAGSTSPKKTASKGNFNRWNQIKLKIYANKYKINHWKIINCDYSKVKNINATWFIDPPYLKGGRHYKHSYIDYSKLATWSKKRIGQVIVCESEGANWLDFKPLHKHQGAFKRQYNEVVFLMDNTKNGI